MKLEYVDTLVLAHPYVKSFDRVNYCLDETEQHAVCIGEVPQQMEGRSEKDLIEGQGGTYWTTTFYIGLQIERKPGEFSLSPLFCHLEIMEARVGNQRERMRANEWGHV